MTDPNVDPRADPVPTRPEMAEQIAERISSVASHAAARVLSGDQFAALMEEAEKIQQLGMTVAARPRRLALLQSLAAGFHQPTAEAGGKGR